MKKALCLILIPVLTFGLCACGQEEKLCTHEFAAEAKDGKVILSCKLCGQIYSSDFEIPEKIVEKEVEKEVIKEVEKPVIKQVIKEVEKEIIKEVPVYLSDEERMEAEDYELLNYYLTSYGKLDNLKKYIIDNYYTDVDESILLEGACEGLAKALPDAYSVYNPPVSAEEYMSILQGSFTGIGVEIYADDEETVHVNSLILDGPAEIAGILPGDIIESIDGVSYLGKGLDLVASTLRGEIGTHVAVGVDRDGEHLSFDVLREKVITPSVDYGYFLSGEGYLQITAFTSATPKETANALDELKALGITKLVLDLRGNHGGEVESALEVADMFMDEGVMAYLEDRDGEKIYYRTNAGRTEMKFVVLCDGDTASASEMLCAGIQDNGEAELVGTKTYGKGLVQIVRYLSDGSALGLSEYQYFSPNGHAIDKVGITPDHLVELTPDCIDENGVLISDPQVEKALEILAGK